MTSGEINALRFSRDGSDYVLDSSLYLPKSLKEVFAFFAEAGNLERITPPWLSFRIVSPLPIKMQRGALIDYALRINGIPFRWQSEITEWNPPYGFVDEQRRGPYRCWRHQHSFRAEGPGTYIEDRVRYRVLGGALPHMLLVRPQLRRIFSYRAEAVAKAFGISG